MLNKFLLILLIAGMFIGCSKTTVVLLESGKSQNAILVTNEQGTTKLDEVGNYVDISDKAQAIGEVKIMSKNEINQRFSKVLAITPLKPITHILYFKIDSKELTEASKRELVLALKSIKERSPCDVDIIGHTDTTGSNEMNAKLSLERAKYIESIIRETKVEIVSLVAKGYGEEDLLVETEDNQHEAKNRNVEIFIK